MHSPGGVSKVSPKPDVMNRDDSNYISPARDMSRLFAHAFYMKRGASAQSEGNDSYHNRAFRDNNK